MSEASPQSAEELDFVQARWPLLIAGLSLASAAAALLVVPSMHFGLTYALMTVWASWAIYAYAQGKRFHVAPGMYAEADASQKHRRLMLGICLFMHLVSSALLISKVFSRTL